MIVSISDILTHSSKEEFIAITNLSVAMFYKYNEPNRLPTIDVAISYYLFDNTVLHPFAEESIQVEISKMRGLRR